MAGRFTVIPEDTFKEIQVDAGILLTEFDPDNPSADFSAHMITATTGGIQVNCTPSFDDFGADIDNCPNDTMELKRLTGWECSVSTTAVGTSPAVIKLALGAADIAGSKVTPRANLNTDFSDFQDLWWVGDRTDGGFVAVKIMNALATGGLSIQTGKNVKGQFSLEIRGHVSIYNQDVVPMVFYSTEATPPTPPGP